MEATLLVCARPTGSFVARAKTEFQKPVSGASNIKRKQLFNQQPPAALCNPSTRMVAALASRDQGAVGTATSEGGCGCAKRCGCEEKREEEENYYSDNPWEGIIGREEFLDALGAGPNAVGRPCSGVEKIWTLEEVLRDVPPNLIFEEELTM